MADVYPLDDPEKAELIHGCIGEASPFHETFGYYARGVGPETAMLPAGWKVRLVRLESPGTVGWCLSPEDLAVSKLAARRDNDLRYVRTMLKRRLVSEHDIRGLLPELSRELAGRIEAWLAAMGSP